MANLNFPMGFVPIRYINGKDLSTEDIEVDASNAAIYIGDLLERRSDGYIHVAQATSTTLMGVAAEYKAANAGGTIKYYPLEGLVMKAQVNGSVGVPQSDFDLEFNIVVTTGDTVTKYSKHEINPTGAATATLPIKILRLWPSKNKEGNVLGGYMKVVCMANQGVTKGAGTIG